ncbi:WD40 repeat domain-containing protein [Lignipirellula cremea]|uniref:WD domain, G-beta repeat n=1 Tax=Lignipirellula cremea TaxID=2528010 RepID=A0A518DYP9_9BACT|nr:hypothetical protein [Lignipirellula cremea]QDU96970.1 WD domain, G-beta repeat [Lignipirellula cremea]
MAQDAQPTPQPVSVVTTDRQMALVRFSPCGQFLAAAGRDGSIRRWRYSEEPLPQEPETDPVKAKKAAKELPQYYADMPAIQGHNGWVSRVEYHPTQKTLIAADSWGKLAAWTYEDDQAKAVWEVEAAHDGWLRQFAFSPDGKQIATCGMDHWIRLWSATDGKLQAEWKAGEEVHSLVYHPTEPVLVSGDLFGVVKQWDLATKEVKRELDASVFYLLSRIQDVGGVRTLTFDKDGKVLAATGTKPTGGGFVQGSPVVRFFDWSTGKETETLELGPNTDGYIHDFHFHPDGYWIGAASGQPGKGKFFLLKPGEKEPFYTQVLPNCHSIALHPDANRIAVVANAGIYGQAKSMAREGIYPGNSSPIHIYDLTTV